MTSSEETRHPPAGGTNKAAAAAAVALLEILDGTTVEASHIAAAIARHRRGMLLEGSGVPVSLTALEKVFAEVAVGPRRVTTVHGGPEVGRRLTPDDGGPMPELLTRSQAAKRLRCSISTIKRRERAGDLIPIRHGRVVRHRRTDIDTYLNGAPQC